MHRPSIFTSLLLAVPVFGDCSSSLETEVGNHVIWSWSGTTPPQALYKAITNGLVGGVITFGENIDSSTPSTIAKLQSTWASSSRYNNLPLLILTDQEGGEVVRLPGGPTQSAKSVGSSSNPASAATSAGQTAAQALKNYNHNGNLAPVLGVYRQAGDFLDQYDRSYSMNASIVSECGAAFVSAQQGKGVIATAKHFPGLGAATSSEDTDAKPVTINLGAEELRSVDMLPYQAVIGQAGVDMVMASWALYPTLDAKYPAGLSSKIIQGELRQRLGFGGVTITDAIEAGGLNAFGKDDGHRAVLATQAGMDVILGAARNVSQGTVIVNEMVKALQNGTLDCSKFKASTARILSLRRKI